MGKTLILLELDGAKTKRASLHAITLAQQLGDDYALVLLGHKLDAIAETVASYGATCVLVADDAALAEPLADRYATVLAEIARQHDVTTLLAASSTFSKDILPRAAALLDAPMVTDVLGLEKVDDGIAFRRPVSAGSLLALVQVKGDRRVLTARPTAFAAPNEKPDGKSPVERFPIDAASLPNDTKFVSREERKSDRPDLTEARVVIAGGRPLKDTATFEKLVGGLAGRARRRDRRDPRRGRFRDGAERLPDRSDREGDRTGALHRPRYFRRDPASRGHQGFARHRGDQQRR